MSIFPLWRRFARRTKLLEKETGKKERQSFWTKKLESREYQETIHSKPLIIILGD
jgi:hypothetical protein